MSYRAMTCIALIAAAVLATNASCSRGPRRILPPSINASAAGAKAIEMFDKNKDGKLSGEELDKCPGLKSALSTVDPSNQGVTAEAITARIRAWQDSKLGRTSLSCVVMHNGQPLGGAEIKLVPEKFLGDDMPVVSGKTGKSGMAMLSVPVSGKPDDPPGVPPGFYRIEITKPGMTIPAKYNTETTLGQEVAQDAKEIAQQRGIRVELKF